MCLQLEKLPAECGVREAYINHFLTALKRKALTLIKLVESETWVISIYQVFILIKLVESETWVISIYTVFILIELVESET